MSRLRCIVTGWDADTIRVTTADGAVRVKLSDSSLLSLLTDGTSLNLLDCQSEGDVLLPELIVLEPDYLLDISAIAACFKDYGHHPLNYLVNRMKATANTQPILLGNYASAVLDDIIHHTEYDPADTLRQTFRRYALQFCTCAAFNGQQFKSDAAVQVANIRDAVNKLFSNHYDRTKALLEPSFVCEQLGLQGRVDLMTTDLRLLVEQKSGRNWNIERPDTPPYRYKEDHYVQLLLYYGVLRYNFHLAADRVDMRLLYSKYPASHGLLPVSFFRQLFHEAISLRNKIVAQEIGIARHGFASIMPLLKADTLLGNRQRSDFFERYIRPQADAIFQPLHQLSATEHDYVERMLTFVYREQLAQKVGVQDGPVGAVADLWNMPLSEKQENGTIMTGPIADKSSDTITLRIDTSEGLPNFRRGDMVYLYHYEDVPDVRKSILFKGTIQQLTDTEVTVRLNDRQQDTSLFVDGSYAVEHGASDIGSTSAIRAIHAFCTASQDRRDLLLGVRPPRRDVTQTLTLPCHPHYEDVVLRSKQARDYFLLQGPPGTGKTSMALRLMVQEELQSPQSSLLLTAYTNRAVDEICQMLEEASIDYLRMGNESSCDPRFAHRLADYALGQQPKLSDVQRLYAEARVIVSTTSTLQSRLFVLQLKRFSLCIVDEASQILEPQIIGLLASSHIARFILIGDHKQLPAVVAQPDDEPRLSSCRQSLFERLLRQERMAGRDAFVGLLNRQGRMHPDVAAFPNEMFYPSEQLVPVPCLHQTESRLDYPEPAEDALDTLLQQRRVLFLPSAPCYTEGASDKVNISEARIVADLMRRIHRQYGQRFHAATTLGVIVPYRNQIAMIRHEIALLGIRELLDVSIDTVERYQGSQRDVIIYSFTVQQPYQLDFLTASCFREGDRVIDRKLNVAMTRARKQLLMTGQTELLCQNSIFAELIRRYQVNAG